MSTLAPIVLFAYNRPWHTEQTLNALRQNELADQSTLFIYADGAKENANEQEKIKINEVRKVISAHKWCGEVHLIESDDNKGLAASVIAGVTEIVNKFGKIIVLEDDVVTSSGFLRYMNDALEFYLNEEKVFHVSGYMFPVKKRLPSTFFYNTASCWGWGTWKRAWRIFNNDAHFLLSEINSNTLKEKFNIKNSYDFYSQLEANKNDKLKTWAVKWYASFFLQNGFSLHPYPSLTNNIGHDGLGQNCGVSSNFYWKELASSISVKKIALKENNIALRAMVNFNSKIINNQSKNYSQNLKDFIKEKIVGTIPGKIKHLYRLKYNIDYKQQIHRELEEKRISMLPRFTTGETNLLQHKVEFVDAASFQFIKNEIFNLQIYKFNCSNKKPYIIDCGANIGLSIIYFKQLFPDAEIVAFEPDNKVFKVLKNNIKAFGFTDVTPVKKACWNSETTLQFYSEGADAGRAAKDFDSKNIIEVETISLRSYVDKKVDFLKIDIEGAENEVLHDISDLLINVDRIFVEYHSFIGKEQVLSEILSILKSAGFRVNVQHIGVYSSNPFIAISDYNQMDLQLNIYGYRS